MKASDMVAVLSTAILEHGDVEVVLHGTYGNRGSEFRLMNSKEQPSTRIQHCSLGHDHVIVEIHIWTDVGD